MANLANCSRRTVVAGGLSLAVGTRAAGASLPAARRNLAFQVWRNGQRIGTHTVTFQTSGGDLTAAILAQFVVRLGPVPVYHYRHEATEVWRDGAFVSFESRSNSNGKHEQVSAVATPAGVRITDGAGRVSTLAADAAPLTHWNRDALRRPLFNPQTSVAVHASLVQKAGDSFALADGRAVPATRMTLSGSVQVTDWYDADDSWTGLRGRVDDGSYLDYKRA